MRIIFSSSVVLLFNIFIASAQGDVMSLLQEQEEDLRSLVSFELGERFLSGVKNLPIPGDTTLVYYNKESKKAYGEDDIGLRESRDMSGWEELKLGKKHFYFTKYGTPLAYIAPLKILSDNDINISADSKLLDFGFGSIGQLLLFEQLGARVTGVEVNPILQVLYQDRSSNLNLIYGKFPSNNEVVDEVGEGYDLFLSKNTLKKGYVNPDKKVDPKFTLQLEVTDEEYLSAVYSLLNPGGAFLIYNLHGKVSEEDYRPWTDGRSPYTIEQFKAAGFEVITYNADHTDFAREMGAIFGWDEQMKFEEHLFATYTLVRK